MQDDSQLNLENEVASQNVAPGSYTWSLRRTFPSPPSTHEKDQISQGARWADG